MVAVDGAGQAWLENLFFQPEWILIDTLLITFFQALPTQLPQMVQGDNCSYFFEW